MAMILQLTRLRVTEAIYFGNPLPGSGTGTVTTIAQGNGITNTPNPIVVGGTTALGPLTSDHDFGNFNIHTRNSISVFNVVAYGADPTGATDSRADIVAAITACQAAGGGVVYFDPGLYRVDQVGANVPFVITSGNVTITGAGRTVTKINFVPAGGGAVFQFNNGAVPINYNAIKDLSFQSADAVTQKTMVLAHDLNNFIIERVSNSAGTSWTGGAGIGSIGVHFKGRQELRMRDCEISADQPVRIDLNPNHPISFDHSSVEDCDFTATGITTAPSTYHNPSIRIETGLLLSNCVFRQLACVGGNGAIYWNNTTGASASFVVEIDNIRTEQQDTGGGHTTEFDIDLRSNQALQGLSISNVYLSGLINGVRLTNAKWPIVKQLTYGGGVGTTFLDLSATVENLTIETSFYQTGAVITDASVNPTAIDLVLGGNPGTSTFGSLTSLAGAPPLGVGTTRIESTGRIGASLGASTPTREIDLSGTQRWRGIAAPAVSEANSGTVYFDAGLNKYRVSMNGAAYVDLVGSAGLTGAGVANRLTYWNGTTSLTDEPNIMLGGTYTLDVTGDINLVGASDVIRKTATPIFNVDLIGGTLSVGSAGGVPAVGDVAMGDGAIGGSTGAGVGQNTSVGWRSLFLMSTGDSNTAHGFQSLKATTTGTDNVGIGANAGITNQTGSDNIFIGSGADANPGNLTNAVAIGSGVTVAASDSMVLGNASMKVGIHTSSPAQAFDVDGAIATRHKDIVLVNGLNSDITLTDTSFVRITGPTGAFSIGGFTGGTSGRRLTVFCTVSEQMTIVYLDAGSAAANQITTLQAADVVLRAGRSIASFIYDDVLDLWVLVSYN